MMRYKCSTCECTCEKFAEVIDHMIIKHPQNELRIRKLVEIDPANFHYRAFNSIVKPIPKCGSGIGFKFHTPGTKENNFGKKMFLLKNHDFNPKSQISGIFQKSVLDFKDTPVRL